MVGFYFLYGSGLLLIPCNLLDLVPSWQNTQIFFKANESLMKFVFNIIPSQLKLRFWLLSGDCALSNPLSILSHRDSNATLPPGMNKVASVYTQETQYFSNHGIPS